MGLGNVIAGLPCGIAPATVGQSGGRRLAGIRTVPATGLAATAASALAHRPKPVRLPDSLWGYQGALGNRAQTFAGDVSSGGFWPYLLLWALLALSLFALALQFYHRGTGFSSQRFAARLTPLTACAALFAMLTLTQGWSLHQQLDQAGALQSRDERQAKQAAYERQYQHWQTVPQPVVRQVKLSASLQPQAQQASISATITLHNPHSTAISKLLLGFPRLQFGAELQSLQLPGAQAETIDSALGQQIFTLQPALAPGASIELQIRLELQQPAIAAMPNHQVLRAQFSYLRLLQLLPQLGFVPELRLRDDVDRARFGLAALPAAQYQPSVLAAERTPTNARYDWAILDTTIAVPLVIRVSPPALYSIAGKPKGSSFSTTARMHRCAICRH